MFLAADGRRLDRHGAGRIVRKVARRAGITKAVTRTRSGTRSSPPRSMPGSPARCPSLGLADQAELDALDRAVRSHLDDPRTLVMPHLSFLAWGRKPEAQQP